MHVPPLQTMRRAHLDRALCCLFGTLVLAPWIDEFVRPDAIRGPTPEQRTAVELPKFGLDLERLVTFPAQFERHYADTFGLRDVLLGWRSLERLTLFGVFPHRNVACGSAGWLFYTGESSVPLLRGLSPMTEDELERWSLEIEEHRRYCEARGIAYLFAIGPNKETIYPEHLPEAWNKVGPTRLEQLYEHWRATGQRGVLDLRPALLSDKARAGESEPTYYPLGTHWSDRGALIACREIAAALHASLPALVPRDLDLYELLRDAGPGESWAPAAYVPGWLTQHVVGYEPLGGRGARATRSVDQPYQRTWYEKRENPALSVLVFRDSFGEKPAKYLAESTSLVVSSSEYGIDETLIEAERPSAVIEIYVERKLLLAPPAIHRTAPIDALDKK